MWAIKELQKLEVADLPPEAYGVLARLSPQATHAQCVSMGAAGDTVALFPGALPDAKVDIAVFETVTVIHDGMAMHPACCWHAFEEGTIWPSDARMMLIERHKNKSEPAQAA